MKPIAVFRRRGMAVLLLASALAFATPSAFAGGDAATAATRYLLYLPSRAADVDHAGNIRALQDSGFSVLTMTPAGESTRDYVLRVRDEVRGLIGRGVAPQAITVLGAGVGSPLAALVSSATGNRHVNYVMLGGCNARLADAPRFHMSGRALGLRDADDHASGSCRPLWRDAPKLTRQHDMVVRSGHGAALFDAPRAEWIAPVVAWSSEGRVDLGTMRVADASR